MNAPLPAPSSTTTGGPTDAVAVAPAGAKPQVSDESDDVAWFPVDALPADAVPDLPQRLGFAVRALRAATP